MHDILLHDDESLRSQIVIKDLGGWEMDMQKKKVAMDWDGFLTSNLQKEDGFSVIHRNLQNNSFVGSQLIAKKINVVFVSE